MDTKENIEMAETEGRKSGRNWKESKIIFLILPIVLTVFFPLGVVFYLCGRFSPYAVTLFYVCILYLVTIGFIIYCFVICFVRLYRDQRKHNRIGEFTIFAQVGIPLIFLVLLVLSFFLPESEFMGYSYKFFMCGLRDRVKSKLDVKATRDWLGTSGEEYFRIDHFTRIPSDEWSKSLRVLNPRRVIPSTDENGNRKVRLFWGGGLGRWGVVMGMEDMTTPSSDFRHYGEYRIPVEPGVYVWWAFE